MTDTNGVTETASDLPEPVKAAMRIIFQHIAYEATSPATSYRRQWAVMALACLDGRWPKHAYCDSMNGRGLHPCWNMYEIWPTASVMGRFKDKTLPSQEAANTTLVEFCITFEYRFFEVGRSLRAFLLSGNKGDWGEQLHMLNIFLPYLEAHFSVGADDPEGEDLLGDLTELQAEYEKAMSASPLDIEAITRIMTDIMELGAAMHFYLESMHIPASAK